MPVANRLYLSKVLHLKSLFRQGVFNRKMMMKTKICMKRIEDSFKNLTKGGNHQNLSPSEVEGICNYRRGLLARMLACVPNTASEDTMVCWVLIMVTRIGLLSYIFCRTKKQIQFRIRTSKIYLRDLKGIICIFFRTKIFIVMDLDEYNIMYNVFSLHIFLHVGKIRWLLSCHLSSSFIII